MVDHTQNPNIDIDNQRWLERCQGLDLDMAQRLLRNESDVPEAAINDLVHLARVIKGAEFETPAGVPYDLTMGMNQVDWFIDDQQRGRYGLLELKGLIEEVSDYWGRSWWQITKFGWDYFTEKFRFDLGERHAHHRITALYRTYCLVAHAMRPEDVEVYPRLVFSSKDADLEIHVPPAEREYFDLPYGDSQSFYVEVVTDHNNTERVAHQRTAFAFEDRADALWIFENQATANKFLRRIEGRDDDHGLDSGYCWSPTTPLKTINERAQRGVIPGVDGVMTFQQLETLISEVQGWDEKLAVTDPVRVQELGVGSRQTAVDAWSD